MLYLDASAIVKLVVWEPESGALAEAIKQVGEPLCTSAIARVEVVRAARRSANQDLSQARAVLRRFRLIAVDRALLDAAGTVDGSVLRSLDAIHLASAMQMEALLIGFVAYDRRLLDAAAALGLRTLSPGLDD